jgi:hypothetical protein
VFGRCQMPPERWTGASNRGKSVHPHYNMFPASHDLGGVIMPSTPIRLDCGDLSFSWNVGVLANGMR